jgi:hypothetical protein
VNLLRLVALSSVVLFTACPTPAPICSPTTCPTGCCDANGQCQGGLSVSACGTLGRECSVCNASQVCASGSCQATMSSGGGSSGIGGGSAGGTAGGVAGGQGGGGMEVLACAPGLTLCGSACVNTTNSFGHCGACGQACSGNQFCSNGSCQNVPTTCTPGACPANYFCDMRTSRCEFGCQANSDCNGGQICDASRSLCVCPQNSTLCGGACVPNNTVTACGSRCLSCAGAAGPNAVPACTNGACDFTCRPGYHRCGNQCVSNFDTATCGQRCSACMVPPNATPTCDGNDCGFVCATGFHQCGSDCVSNFDVATCGNACAPCQAPANGVSVCRSASPGGAPACDFECNPGFVRCGNQCRPESITACGATCATCTAPAGAANPQCVNGACQYTCASGFHQCGTQCVSNASVLTCGSMCTPCPSPAFGIATCNGTSCGVQCNPGYHECNGQCVLNSSVNTCGNRCTPCPAGPSGSGTTPTCDGMNCGLACASTSTPNFCNNVCVANSVTTCGSSCQTCTAPANGTAVCSFSTCDFTCNSGFHRCGSQCVSDSSPDTCGSSCTPCPAGPANTTTTCTQAFAGSSFSCGWTCGAGTNRCPAGGNQCVPQDYTLGCGATCAVCNATNPLERGVCGTNGICTTDCVNRCSNACVNVQTSTTNCGSCGTTCGGADRCSMGECRTFCASGIGLGSLLPSVATTTSTFPFVVVDVNGDGRNDFVSVESSALNVRLGEANAQGTGPSGTFSPVAFSTTGLFYFPTQIIAGDLTGDGRPEIVLLNTNSVFEVLRNTGTGNFVRYSAGVYPPSPATAFVPTSATIGDFISGAPLDLLVSYATASGTQSAAIFPGVSTTSSTPVGAPVAANLGIGSVSNVRVASVTADGLPDLVATAAANALFVFPGTGSSGAPFNGLGGVSIQLPGTETFISGVAGSAFPMEAGDVTADGLTDIVVPSISGTTTGVRVFPLTATPAFGTSTFLATPAAVRALAIADVNGDGRRDVIAASTDVRVFLSLAGNTFGPAQVLGITFGATSFNSMAVVDTTGDMRPEVHTPSGFALVTAVNNGSGGFTAVQGSSVPNATRIAAGDLNGDGLSDAVAMSPRMGSGPIMGVNIRLVDVTSTGSTIRGRVEVFNAGAWGTVCSNIDTGWETQVLCRSLGLGSATNTFTTAGGVPGVNNFYCSSSTFSSWQSCTYDQTACLTGPAQIECSSSIVVSPNTTAQVLYGAANNTFTAGSLFDTRTDRLAIGNLNADAPLDLVVGSAVTPDGGVSAIEVRLGTTGTTLGTPNVLPVLSQPTALAIAELSGDTFGDIVVGSEVGVQVFRGTGAGAFAPPVLVSTTGASSIAVADLNLDGKRDLVLANSTSTALQPLMNVAVGNTIGFVAVTQLFTSNWTNYAVLAGDVNYDGRPDLVFGRQAWSGNGAGAFTLLTSSLATLPPRQALVDLDNDGALDLVGAGSASSVLAVARGTSSTSFGFATSPQNFTSGSVVEDVAVARVNTDATRDLVLLQGASGARFVSAVPGVCR